MRYVRIASVHSLLATTFLRHTRNACIRAPLSTMAGADSKPKRSGSTTPKIGSKSPLSPTGTMKSTSEKSKLSKKSKAEPARTASKVDGRAKALGVGGLASLLHAQSPQASSSRTPVEKPKCIVKTAGGLKAKDATREHEAGEGEAIEQDRGMMLQWANQAIATSKTGISLDQIKEDEIEAKKENAMKKRVGSVDYGQKPPSAAAAKDSLRSNPR
jgi:hypothetical protein